MQSRVRGTKMLETPTPAPLGAKYPLNHCVLHAKVPRTAILVSVRNSEELKLVFKSGVLWIDLKEPRNGPLGCPSQEQVTEFLAGYQEVTSNAAILSEIGTQPRISIALGDLGERFELPLGAELLQQFEMLKVGITNEALSNPEASVKLAAWQRVSGVADRFVLVHYPDVTAAPAKTWKELLRLAEIHGIRRVLIDTLVKNGRSTLEYYSSDLLRSLIEMATESRIETMVAGSLRLSELESVWQCGAKIIGIRSAVCQGNSRSGAIDTDRLRHLGELCIHDNF